MALTKVLNPDVSAARRSPTSGGGGGGAGTVPAAPKQPADISTFGGGPGKTVRQERADAAATHMNDTYRAEKRGRATAGAGGQKYPESRAAHEAAKRVSRDLKEELAPVRDALESANVTSDPFGWVPEAIKKAAPASWNLGPRKVTVDDLAAMDPTAYTGWAKQQKDVKLRDAMLGAQQVQRDVHDATLGLDITIQLMGATLAIAEFGSR